MPRLDVHPMPGKDREGYVLDVQADLLSHLATRTVVPLLPEHPVPKPISGLNPVFEIEGHRCVMVTQAIATIPIRELQRPVGTMTAQHDAITPALDIRLLGF